MSPTPPAAFRPPADTDQRQKRMQRHLAAIERALDTQAVLGQDFPNDRIVDY